MKIHASESLLTRQYNDISHGDYFRLQEKTTYVLKIT